MGMEELIKTAQSFPDFVNNKDDWEFGDNYVDESSVLEDAILLASLAHGCQRDKNNRPYILHCLRVMMQGKNDDAKIVGVLHDILEDTEMTGLNLLEEGIPLHLVRSIIALTHNKRNKEPRHDYYDRIKADKIAYIVKGYDLEDNSNRERLIELEEKDRERLRKKYAEAYEYLYGFIPEHLQ